MHRDTARWWRTATPMIDSKNGVARGDQFSEQDHYQRPRSTLEILKR